MWFYIALLSGLFYSVQGLITRKVLKGVKKDSWALSFYFSLIGSAVSLPFFFTNLKVSNNLSTWVVLLFVGVLIVIQNLFNFKSTNFLSASIVGAITKFRLVWIFLLGAFILKESLTLYKIIGTTFTIIAGLVILKNLRSKSSLKGISYAFIATIFYATVIILYKYLFKEFNSQSLTFFIFLIPAIINIFIMPNSIKRVINLSKEDGLNVFTACVFGAFANLTMNYALSIGEVSRVNVLIESFLIVTLVGENIFLREKENTLVKLLAILIAIAGAILLRK